MSNTWENLISFSKAGCLTIQVIRLPLANRVGTILYWLMTVTVSFGNKVELDSISPRPPSQSISAAGFPVAAVQMAAIVWFAPSIRGFGPFVKLTIGSTTGEKKGKFKPERVQNFHLTLLHSNNDLTHFTELTLIRQYINKIKSLPKIRTLQCFGPPILHLLMTWSLIMLIPYI